MALKQIQCRQGHVILSAVVACLLLSVVKALPSDATLKRVVLAHRHGARTPIDNVNGACDKIGCGELTEQGAEMLISLGNAVRARYGAILTPHYDVTFYPAKSDSITRTIQSASAFLTGLFQSTPNYTVYPAIHTASQSHNTYLFDPWSHIPTFRLHDLLMDAAVAVHFSGELSKYISTTDVVKIGKELGLSEVECALVPLACAWKEVDYLAYAESEGTLPNFPVGNAHYQSVRNARAAFYKLTNFGYDMNVKNNTFFTDAGFPGSYLLQQIVAQAKNDDTILAEFSGHDITLMPMWTTMGNYTWQYPGFATAAIFEIYQTQQSGNRSGHLWVRSKVAVPVETPGAHPYTFSDYSLVCLSATNGVYQSVDGCPLEEWEAYLQTRATPSSDGPCYAWPKDLDNTFCDFHSKADPKLPCGEYRKACPLVGCGQNYYMTSDLSCHQV